MLKLADATWLVGDYTEGAPSANSTLFLQSEFAISSVRWLRLDIDRVVTRGTWVEKPDLSKVDEVGFADLTPGSGHGWGGFVNVARIEVLRRRGQAMTGRPSGRDSNGKSGREGVVFWHQEALMTRQLFAVIAVTVSIVAAVTVRPEADQSSALTAARAASTARYVPAKTPWGDPDLQGGYSNKDENGIPFERPGNLSGKQLGEFDDSELAELAQSRDANRLEQARGIGGRETGAGPVHWYEHYGAKNSRAWLVVDPPEGTIPAQTAAAQQRLGRGRGAPAAAPAGPAAGPQPRRAVVRAGKGAAPIRIRIAASTIGALRAVSPVR